MTQNRFKITYLLFFVLFFNFAVKGQYIYNFSSHNFLQFNPAYAGQDTNHCFFLGAELNTELLKSKKERIKGAPYALQFSYAGNFNKFKSGLAAIGSIYSIGSLTQYDIGLAYNVNVIINESSNLRLGINWHERIIHEELEVIFYWNNGGTLTSRTKKGSNLDLGLWFALKKFQFGFSVKNVLEEERDLNFSQFDKKVYFNKAISSIACYEFTISESVKAKPTVILERFERIFSRDYIMCLLSCSIEFHNTFILGSGYMLREFIPDGPLYIEAGAKASNQVKIMLGYSGWINEGNSSENISAMVKVNLY